MFDCIYRDEVKQKIKERMEYLDYARILNKRDAEILNQIKGFEKALNQIYCDIDDIRTADMQSVKRGRWIDCTFYDPCEKSWEQNYEFKCSNCEHKIYNKPNDDTLFCGHCSARMDLKDGDAK